MSVPFRCSENVPTTDMPPMSGADLNRPDISICLWGDSISDGGYKLSLNIADWVWFGHESTDDDTGEARATLAHSALLVSLRDVLAEYFHEGGDQDGFRSLSDLEVTLTWALAEVQRLRSEQTQTPRTNS